MAANRSEGLAGVRLSGRAIIVIGALVGIIAIAATGQIAPAQSEYQAQLRVWLAARATGITAYLVLTVVVALGLILSHPVNQSTWKLSKRLFPWHENLFIFVTAFVAVHVVALVLDPYAGLGVAGAIVPGLSTYRTVPVALGNVALYALLISALTARYTKLLPSGVWLKLHRGSLLIWAVGWAHGILAGTDTSPLAPLYVGTGLVMVGAAAYRYWVARKKRPTFATSLPEGDTEAPARPARDPHSLAPLAAATAPGSGAGHLVAPLTSIPVRPAPSASMPPRSIPPFTFRSLPPAARHARGRRSHGGVGSMNLRLRRTLVAAGVIASLVVGVASIEVAAGLTAAAAPPPAPPVSISSLKQDLAAEQARSASLQDQLNELLGVSDSLSAILNSTADQVSTDGLSAEQLRQRLSLAQKKLASVSQLLADAQARLAATQAAAAAGPAAEEDGASSSAPPAAPPAEPAAAPPAAIPVAPPAAPTAGPVPTPAPTREPHDDD